MDVRDSLPTSATSLNRDGSPSSAEVKGFLPVIAALAKEATSLFQLGKYADCIDVLNQLNQKKQNDPKVLHNIAIAEYYRDGCSVPNSFLDVWNKVKERSEELAPAPGEQVEAVGKLGNKVNLVPNGNKAVANQNFSTNKARVLQMDEFETSIATLNKAIAWFSLHKYIKALSILEPLYQNIELVDELTALNICFLSLDAGIACNDALKCAEVLLYMDKAFGINGMNQSDSGSVAQQQSGNLVSKSSSIPRNTFKADPFNSDLASDTNALEDPFSRTLSDETLEYESVLSSLDIAGQNVSRPAGFSASNDLSRKAVSIFMSTIDVKLKLQLYKVRFLMLTRNLKQAKREAKHTMNFARNKDLTTALLLKAQLEYARGNYHKAIKLLMASSTRMEIGILSIFHNNLGCIYYQLGNYHTASVFFSRALSNSTTQWKDKPLKLSTLSKDKSLLIMYNCGVQYLVCGKPQLAACCFEKASVIFYNRPLLWLRLAECCLMALEKGLLGTKPTASSRSDLPFHVIGKGKWRHLVLEGNVPTNGHINLTGRNENGVLDGNKQPKLSVSFARQCLLNALYLLDNSELSFSTSGLSSNSTVGENEARDDALASQTSNFKNLHSHDPLGSPSIGGLNQGISYGETKEQRGATVQELVLNSLSCYEAIKGRERLSTKQALLANLAFVELELENPQKALAVAKSLLELPDCSRVYIFLGHVYAAEALCLLNRLKDAAEHLLGYLTGGKDFGLPFSQEDCDQWRTDRSVESEDLNGGSVPTNISFPEDSQCIVFSKPEEARALLYANFATISAVQGEFEQARHFVLEALSLIPNSRQPILTAVYVDIMMGKSQEAIAKLKQCSCVRFISSGLALSKP